ncbi:uncharacterized protein FOMMEDRAFT_170239 [Fomitiporia mediterranea MF3/22]|uniref:uncharacterized protein n=1 Tax=Fomitiporia mediterranea (strain MF3/22) TaxID=694068 RepID=UPI0004409BEE|nr:uncharacterized protein FOMMEDRAFT_170239 [Fomitiporia mediterranea MF3/22]EJC99574.1 hypothetical protein FOMMEDRAFT_170239 [Fomitiporia mediterranea MF3/22]
MASEATSSHGPPIALTLFDWLKPRRSVAVARLKNNCFALVILLLITQLAPIVPSPITCLSMLLKDGKERNFALRWLCWIELALFSILSANIVQSYIGIRYPPTPCGPVNSPAKQVQAQTPQLARPLKSFSTPLSQKGPSLSSSYATPISTPSRMGNYKGPLATSSPSSSPFQNSLNSSFSASLLSSPLAHRARHSQGQSVRSMRGSLLIQFEADEDDEL